MTQSQTPLKPLGLLETIVGMSRAPTLAELTAATGLPKATLHRWLKMLDAIEIIRRTPDGRRYELAPRAYRLAISILSNESGGMLRHTILKKAVAALGESCNFTVLSGNEVIYVDRVESVWPLRITLQPGSRVPIHCSASGKLFLAYAPPSKREQMLKDLTYERYTNATLTSRAGLTAEISTVRKLGYALDREEYLPGLICIAVPIIVPKGRSNHCAAALAMQAPAMRMSCGAAVEKLPILKRTAAELAATLV